MEKIKSEIVLSNLNWRYAVKKFDSTQKLSDADLKTLEDALLLSASSSGLQPWKFIIVKSQDVKKKLTPVSYNQPQIEDCSHLVVFCHAKKIDENYIEKYIQHTAKVRGVPADGLKAFKDSMVGSIVKGPVSQIVDHWTARQTYIALGFLLTTAAMIGVDSCPMEGFNSVEYDKILGLTETNYKSVAIVALGFRSSSDTFQAFKKVRFPKEELITEI